MTYNLSFMDNTTSILQIWAGVNTESGSWLAGLTLFFLFILVFIVFQDHDTTDVFLADSFFITLLAGLFLGAGLLPGWALAFPIVALVVSTLLKLWK